MTRILQNINVGMEMGFVKLLDECSQHVFIDNKLIGVDFEHILNKAGHGEIYFILDVQLIHSGPDFRIVVFSKVGVEDIDPNTERLLILRRFAAHEL